MAAVGFVGLMMELLIVSIVVLSDVPDGVSEVVEVTGLMLNAGAVIFDSVISRELNSSPISVFIVVFVTVITTYDFDRLPDILDGGKANLWDSSQHRNDSPCRWFPDHIFSSILVLTRGLPRSLRRDSRNRHSTFLCNHNVCQNSRLSFSICKREPGSSILAYNRFLSLSSAIALRSRESH